MSAAGAAVLERGGPVVTSSPWQRPAARRESVLADLRTVAAGRATLSMREYARRRSPLMLSPAWIVQSFGPWSKVCADAGLGVGPCAVAPGNPSWTLLSLRSCVDDFLTEAARTKAAGSYREFVRWCAADPTRPCATSVRVRLGRWNTVKTESLVRLEGVAR